MPSVAHVFTIIPASWCDCCYTAHTHAFGLNFTVPGWFIFFSAGVSNQRKVGFVERRHKEPMQERVEHQKVDSEAVGPGGGTGLSGAETAAARLRAQRSLSPEGHRSSSLPPPAHRNIPSTPPPCMCPPSPQVLLSTSSVTRFTRSHNIPIFRN